MTQLDPICRICLRNTASKKNSHLIPWFLIKNSKTQQGVGIRDTEITFSINSSRDTVFLGRSVLQESASEIFVKDLIKEEVKNPLSRDYLFCPQCENKLGRLESIFATQFSKMKVTKYKNEDLISIGASSIAVNRDYSDDIFGLLVQSIFYRCSVGEFSSVKLDSKTEKHIELNLRECFSNQDITKITHRSRLPKILQFPILATRFISPISPEGRTEGFIFQNKLTIPYFIMAGDWTFQLYRKSTHLQSSIERLYGLKEFADPIKAYQFIKQSAHAILLSQENEMEFRRNVLDFLVERRMNSRKQLIRSRWRIARRSL
jgi:hypothetical protein